LLKQAILFSFHGDKTTQKVNLQLKF